VAKPLFPRIAAQKAKIPTPFSLRIFFSDFRNIPSPRGGDQGEGDGFLIHPTLALPRQKRGKHCEEISNIFG
jgi:hypothetical protein